MVEDTEVVDEACLPPAPPLGCGLGDAAATAGAEDRPEAPAADVDDATDAASGTAALDAPSDPELGPSVATPCQETMG